METLLELLKKTETYYTKKGIKNPRLEAEKLFAKALNLDRIMLYAKYDEKLSKEQKEIIKRCMQEDVKEENEIKKLLDSSIVYLKKHNINEAALIAELIFSNVMKIDRLMLFMSYDKKIDDDQKEKIRKMLKKIAIDMLPYQYIINQQNFYGRDFYVDKGVLIPRYDTENLVEKVIKIADKNSIILDIGTGSGAIGITLALELPDSKVLAVDISEKAIDVARKNKEDLSAKNVKILKSDVFSNVSFHEFDVIVSNPPYISNEEIENIGLDTYIHEPHEALFAKSDGLYFYYKIANEAREYLKNNGILAFEIGYKQKEAVCKILEEFSYCDINTYKDLDDHDRVIICRYRRG